MLRNRAVVGFFFNDLGKLKKCLNVYCSCFSTNLPRLIVFLLSRGSRTGSTFSGRFSITTVSPKTRACSITSKQLYRKKKHEKETWLELQIFKFHKHSLARVIQSHCDSKTDNNLPLLTLSVQAAPPSALTLADFWSTWCPAAVGRWWVANAHWWSGWPRSQ